MPVSLSSLFRLQRPRWLRWPVSSLRAYLAAVIVVATVPLACFALYLLHQQAEDARSERQAALYRLVNSLALVVEREMASSTDALTLLSHDAALQRGDAAEFQLNLLRWPLARPSWSAVMLVDRNGRVLASSPPGQPAIGPSPAGTASARPGDLVRAAGTARFATTVEVPVVLPSGPHRLVARIAASQWQTLIEQASVPRDGFVSLVDGSSRVIATSREPERHVGRVLPIERQAQLLRQQQGGLRLPERAAQPLVTLQQVAATGWWVGAGVSTPDVAWAEVATLSSALMAGLLSLSLGLLLALRVARRVSEPLRRLAHEGPAAAQHGIVVREIAALRDALKAADAERAAAMQALQAKADEYQALLSERLALMEREQAARRTAEEANRSKDEFLAMLGHELRNPLSAIGAAVEVINRVDPQHETAVSARRIIGRQTQQLVGLMNDLMDMARATAGKIQLTRQPLNLARLVWRTHAALRLAGRFEHQSLTLELDEVWAEVDTMRIEQVVSNLLTNAAKYTPPDGRISVTLRAVDGMAELVVDDTGMGIPTTLLPRVFDLFVQGERTHERRQGGLGLGLTLVRRMVELHGGTVTAHSPGSGLGSRFTVRLAATRSTPPPQHRPRPLVLLGTATQALQPLESLLEQQVQRITTCPNAPAALALLRNDIDFEGALVVVDPSALAPELDAGLLALRAARTQLRLVALCPEPADLAFCQRAGFDACIAVPLTLAVLREQLALGDTPTFAA
ncbi:sensor histidine kinase [Ideonella sp. BN130291]|uniref:sensor histidine kinase n=1 Tax=Ideonella sp. BN130291 TaxID=3112940 RepID=UPI002E273213|nr:sensor histidine kinase [Ideonella sp. BN130291]